MEYLEFELEISSPAPERYAVAVVESPGGEARDALQLPYDDLALSGRLKDLQIALLRSRGTTRRIPSDDEATVQGFGADLLRAALPPGSVRSCYDVSMELARQQRRRLRFRLRILPPELARLPWEFLYDPREGEFLALSREVSLVRYLELPGGAEPLTVTSPLRVLCMVASPSDLPALDAARERARLDEALAELRRDRLLEVSWLEGQTWRSLQAAMWKGPWHIFHFIGHGDFDQRREEGMIALVADEDGRSQLLTATQLARLLAGQDTRLAVLNSCEGAAAAETDIFSSTAATLVRRGIPAVLAMQYQISDEAALEFSRTFYKATALGMPVDASVGEARIAISLTSPFEWATPVLHMRSPDGKLFELAATSRVSLAPEAPPASRESETLRETVPAGQTVPGGHDEAPPRPEPPPPPPPTPGSRAGPGGWIDAHRRAIGLGLAGIVLAAALAVGLVVRNGGQGAPVPRPPGASPPLFTLDVQKLGNVTVLGPTPGLKGARWVPAGDHAELDFSAGSGNVLLYDVASLTAYREELELSASGSNVSFYVLINQQPPSNFAYSLLLDPAKGTGQLLRQAPDGSQQALGQEAPIPGLRAGRRVALTVVAHPPRYTVLVGGQAAIDVTESEANRTPGRPGLAGVGDAGSVRIYRAEVFAQSG